MLFHHLEKLMMKIKYLTYGFAMTALMAPMSTGAFAYSGEKLATKAKITIEDARSIALKAQPGTITDEELEKEKGGSGLRYSFDIKSGKITYEVGVDAMTGNVLENSKEGRNPD
jgi:uncharacterized membrane protein YkoI